MYEGFTDSAIQVIVLAQEEARILKHNYIGTGHILLGLQREKEGLAAEVLTSLGITLEHVRAQVIRIVGSNEEIIFGQIPFTERAKKLIELPLREALALGDNYVDTEHIILALGQDGRSYAGEESGIDCGYQILLESGASDEIIRNQIKRRHNETRQYAHRSRPRTRSVTTGPTMTLTWEDLCLKAEGPWDYEPKLRRRTIYSNNGHKKRIVEIEWVKSAKE
jgi:ATP-dependent Clp protease ATP-binding subunit ClpA